MLCAMKEKNTTIHVAVHDSLYRAFETSCRVGNYTRSEAARQAIREWVERRQEQELRLARLAANIPLPIDAPEM